MARIGLVLGAGFAKGAYQCGALKALSEYISVDKIERVSASSVGALNAVAYCSDNLEFLEEVWLDITNASKSRFIGATMRSKYLKDMLDVLSKQAETLKTKLYITLANISNMTAEYFNLSRIPADMIAPCVHASISMPGFNKAVNINGKRYIDGGWFDNIPVFPLQKHNLDYIIVIHFDKNDYVYESESLNDRIINITFPDNTMFSNALFLKGESINRMLTQGYEVAKSVFSELFRNGTDALDYIYAYIKEQNAVLPKRSLRLTTDVVINNINRVTKKITRKIELEDEENEQ